MAKYRSGPATPVPAIRATVRLDKWLWQARFYRTRSAATEAVAAGHFRVNAVPGSKPAHAVGQGDTLTFPHMGRIRLIRVLALAGRRGDAAQAQTLYRDLDAPESPQPLE